MSGTVIMRSFIGTSVFLKQLFATFLVKKLQFLKIFCFFRRLETSFFLSSEYNQFIFCFLGRYGSFFAWFILKSMATDVSFWTLNKVFIALFL